MSAERVVLPTGTSMNPARPEGSEFYDERLTAVVLHKPGRSRPTRVVTTYGGSECEEVGSTLTLRHDQTGALLGTYVVVGLHVFATGETTGVVPDRQIRHAVYK